MVNPSAASHPEPRQKIRPLASRGPFMAVTHSALTRAILLAGVAGTLALTAPAHAADYKITILHVNDLRSRLEPVTESGAKCTPEDSQAKRCAGGVARLAARIKSEKA